MKARYKWTCLVLGLLLGSIGGGAALAETGKKIALPAPSLDGEQSVEALLQQRRSLREYRQRPISLQEVGQLLWAAQGITHTNGYRTAPSAGALYPLELYLVAGNVTGLPAGAYHYRPKKHRLSRVVDGDLRSAVAEAAYGQQWIEDAAAIVVFTAVPERTARKYGKRAQRYVDIEVGHAAQNLFLQAGSLGLGSVVVGAMHDSQVGEILALLDDQQALLLMPVGHAQ
jgi:SagB-type dehydrogenase family enzyme